MTTKELTTAQHAKHALAIARNTVIVRELASELAAAEKHLQEIETRARAAGFFAGVTTYKGSTYSIATAEKQSYSLTAEDSELVQFARRHGLKTSAPKPESCSSSTIRAAALRGIDVTSVCDVTTNEVYAVSVH
jgi:hypothetical protein